jgi:hypothetical protein
MDIKSFSIVLYGLSGSLFLIISAVVFLVPTGILPDAIAQIVFDFGQGNPVTLHIIQELSSLLLFTGLISIWFAHHYEHSMFYHWAMTAFFGYFAFVHWVSIHGEVNRSTGPIVTAIPFVVFLLVGLMRKKFK